MVGNPFFDSASPLTALPLADLAIGAASNDPSVFCLSIESKSGFGWSSVTIAGGSAGGLVGTEVCAAGMTDSTAVSGCCVESPPLSEATLTKETDEAKA